MEKPFHVFCCYAREDKKYLLLLKKHLKPLERRGSIIVQADIDVSPGEEWEKKISQYLNTAHIILLLISLNFMDSDYCYSKEMKRAIERHEQGEARVVPIILQPVNWQGMSFSKLQALPTDGVAVTSRKWRSRDEAFHNIAKGIETAIEGADLSTDRTKFGAVPPLFTVLDLPLSFVKRREEMQASQEKTFYGATHTGEHSSRIHDTSTISSSTPAIYARPFLVPPLPVQSVIGRDKILADISTRLALFDATATEISPIALRGMGGVGKTTLALALGRQKGIRTSFPDGVLWVEIGPRPLLRQLLHDWGRALGVDLIPERDEQACSQRLRDILSERQVLIIVDDVWEEEHGSIFQIAGLAVVSCSLHANQLLPMLSPHEHAPFEWMC